MENNSYTELVKQTFGFPQPDIRTAHGSLFYQDVDMKKIIEKHGTPLKITYLPKIGQQIEKAMKMFKKSFAKRRYRAKYYYAYCTKSSHFSFILNEVLKHDVHIETSSAYDFDILQCLHKKGKITHKHYIVCNGFKPVSYMQKISGFMNNGFQNTIAVLDNKYELEYYKRHVKAPFKIGIRVAAEEEPSAPFYTGRLGIRSKDIVDYYLDEIQGNEKRFQFKMLHLFLQNGIKDDIYYWSELRKVVSLYCKLRKVCPELDCINIGGGFPIKHSLGFDYDYDFMVDSIVKLIKTQCKTAGVPEPNLFTEFGSFTVGESMSHVFKVLQEKTQNDREVWYMLDSSFITTMPDTWGIGERFLMLPINKWENEYQRVVLGGLTCDGHDFYDSEEHINEVFLPKINGKNSSHKEPLYIGFFHTGAYQDQISGYGGIKHCLIPSPKHIIIERDSKGNLIDWVYAKQQPAKDMLKILGYN